MSQRTPIQAIATHEKDRTYFLNGAGRWGGGNNPLVGLEQVGASLTVFDHSGKAGEIHSIQLALRADPFSLHLHISPQEARVLANALFMAADRLDELVAQANTVAA